MRAFLVGLLSLAAIAFLGVIMFLLWPVFFVLAIIFRVIFGIVFLLFAVWLLGKFILFIWKKLNPPDAPVQK
jgi:hypothetical protein